MEDGIVKINLHGMNCYQAKVRIDSELRKAGSSVYYIRLIHGYNGGTELKDMIYREYANKHYKVKRLMNGINPGITDLVLREI